MAPAGVLIPPADPAAPADPELNERLEELQPACAVAKIPSTERIKNPPCNLGVFRLRVIIQPFNASTTPLQSWRQLSRMRLNSALQVEWHRLCKGEDLSKIVSVKTDERSAAAGLVEVDGRTKWGSAAQAA